MPLQRMSHAGAAPPTNLLSAITATAMSFGLVSSTGYPTGSGGHPFVLDIDSGLPTEEKVLCASLSGGVVTVAVGGRGWDGTVAVAHSPGTVLAPNVTHIFSSSEADDANAHIYDTTRDDHAQYVPASGARASTLSVQNNATLAVSGNGIMPYDTLEAGALTGFNTSTHTFTAPQTGYYRIYAQAMFTSTANAALVINKNGGGVITGPAANGSVVSPYLGAPAVFVAGTLPLNAGDTVNVSVYVSAATTMGSNGVGSFLIIELVH